jgi:hypothetical protein
MNKRILLIFFGSMFLALAACGLSEEERVQTAAAETAAAASPTPTVTLTATLTPTQTKTPTPFPTSTNTPTPTTSALDIYYPHDENAVWWYAVSVEGEVEGITGFSFIGTKTLADGTVVHLIENRGDVQPSIELMEISQADILLHGMIQASDTDSPIEIIFDPPIPILRFPLEVGKTWSREFDDEEYAYTYEVVAKESYSGPMGDFDDCFTIERSAKGKVNWREYYCPEIGRVRFEYGSAGGTVFLDLLLATTARIEIGEVSIDSLGNCLFTLNPVGFSPDESVSLSAFTPDSSGWLVLAEDYPISALTTNIQLSFAISSEETPGMYFLILNGEKNTAFYVIEYNGTCEES